jgi:hypothetical protein
VSTPVALPALRVFHLPRVRFKRPRWPRGNRLWLVLAVVNLATIAVDAIGGRVSAVGLFLFALNITLWWRSRDDDDGPSAT